MANTTVSLEKIGKRKFVDVFNSNKKPRVELEGGETRENDGTKEVPDHVLGTIFESLPIVERLRAEGVSKKWKTAAQYFGWAKTQEISQLTLNSKDLLDANQLRALLERATRIQTLDLKFLAEPCGGELCLADPYSPQSRAGPPHTNSADSSQVDRFQPQDAESEEAVELGVAALVGACSKLEELYLEENPGLIGSRLFRALPGTLLKLHVLRYASYALQALALIAQKCPKLVEFRLTMRSWESTTRQDFLDFLLDLPCLRILEVPSLMMQRVAELVNLTYLKLNSLKSIPEELFEGICNNCSSLEELDFTGWNMSKTTFSTLANLPQLRTLHMSISGCEDEVFEALGRRGKLEKLTLVFCYLVTLEGVVAVIEGCKNLKSIELLDCDGVSRPEFEDWFKDFKEKQSAARETLPVIYFDIPAAYRHE